MKQVVGKSAGRWASGFAAVAVVATAVTGAAALTGIAAAAATVQPARSAMVQPGVHAPAKTATPAKTAAPGYVPAKRTLKYGMHGADVRRLQDRLAQLTYYPGPRDGNFAIDTLEAVWAFQEVQRIPTSGEVGNWMNWRLAHPRTPQPLIRNGAALRVEVDLRHEVLYVYHDKRIVLISHVSSGGGYYYCVSGSCGYAVTPTGNFHTLSRDRGWHVAPLGLLYNPVFFDGGFAIHGDTEVPLQPVSHGCVRIPMDVANIFPGLVPRNGIPVYIRR
jgi:hypothetical protein